jgi:ABC-type sugar transport system ATPase subunit
VASIILDRLRKEFPSGSVAARDVSLEIGDGELMVLVGPSGSGKSTVLRLIAGLEAATSGRVLIGGRDVTAVPPQDRDLAMVFQSYALYPHLSIRDNLSFGLRVRRAAPAEIARRVGQAAAALGIEALLDRKPSQLSGGQRQRVALGRAIVREPQAFLFDEPLSNLDPALRADTRAEIARLQRRLRATTVYVTHDQEEAMTLGGRIAVMRDGAVEQVDPPIAVYERPANAFVAGFVGSPAMNLFTCRRVTEGGRTRLLAAELPAGLLSLEARGAATGPEGNVTLGIRPQDIELVPPGEADASGRIDVLEPLGSTTLLYVRVGDPGLVLRVLASASPELALDQVVGLRVRRDRVHVFDPATGVRIG